MVARVSDDKDGLLGLYKEGVIDIFTAITGLDAIQNKDVKGKGVIYTPLEVVNYMVELSLIERENTILEPACGHGVFVFALLELAKTKFGLSGSGLQEWFKEKITAVDISPEAISDLRELLGIYFTKEGIGGEGGLENIVCQNFLKRKEGRYDVCIGNPPYVRVKNIEKNDLGEIRADFESCKKGNIDLYYAFMEKTLKEANRVCLIVPNGFLSNVSGRVIKEMLMPRLEVLVDFKDKLVFSGVRAYTCIFRAGEISGSYWYANELEEKPVMIKKERVGVQQKNGVKILSGVATLRDKLFTVTRDSSGGFWTTYSGQNFRIDREMVRPLLKLTKQKGNDFSKLRFIIYPYDKKGKIMPEETLRSQYFNTYQYLTAIKGELEKRDKGKTSGYESWYAYGRKQGLHRISAGRVVVVPQMVSEKNLPFKMDIKNLKEEFGEILFTSGFIIEDDLVNGAFNDFLLSRRFLDFAKGHGKPWPGNKFLYYSLTSRQLAVVNKQDGGGKGNI